MPHLGVPFLNEAQDLCSGVLGVSPTLMAIGASSLQKRKHMCPEDHGYLARCWQGQQLLRQIFPAVPCPQLPLPSQLSHQGVRSGGARNLHSSGRAKLVSNEVAAQEKMALVFACLAYGPHLATSCTGHFIL